MSPLLRTQERTLAASQDLRQTVAYLAGEAGYRASERFIEQLENVVLLLRSTALIGRACQFRNPRFATVRRINVSAPFEHYLIFYTPTDSIIRIERVLHGATNWDAIFR